MFRIRCPPVLQNNGIGFAARKHGKLNLVKAPNHREPVILLALFNGQALSFFPIVFDHAQIHNITDLNGQAGALEQRAEANLRGRVTEVAAEERTKALGILRKRHGRLGHLLRRQGRIVDQPEVKHAVNRIDRQPRFREERLQDDEIIVLHLGNRHKQGHVDARIGAVVLQGDALDVLQLPDRQLQFHNKITEQQPGLILQTIGISLPVSRRI